MQPSLQIADFGLLRHASTNNTETVNILGTPRYMAPEAIRGDISVKIDIFSFGVVILEVITGLASFDKTREDRDIVSSVVNSNNRYDSVRGFLLMVSII